MKDWRTDPAMIEAIGLEPEGFTILADVKPVRNKQCDGCGDLFSEVELKDMGHKILWCAECVRLWEEPEGEK